MTTGIVQTEGRHAGGFMVSEANGRRSRQVLTIDQNQTIVAGQVIGLALAGSGSFAAAAAAAVAGNTGNGTVSAPTVGPAVMAGTYMLRALAATVFEVVNPLGDVVGEARTGVAFAGQIGLTITAGGTAFVAGDQFTVAVTETDPANAGKAVALGVSAGVTNATTASGNAILHFAAVPASIIAGMVVADLTAPSVIPAGTTVLSATATTVTMSANATGGGVGSGDSMTFTAADGSQTPAGISWGNYTTGAGIAMLGTAIVRAAEVRGVDLVYPAGASAAQIAVINTQLGAIGVVVR